MINQFSHKTKNMVMVILELIKRQIQKLHNKIKRNKKIFLIITMILMKMKIFFITIFLLTKMKIVLLTQKNKMTM